jgi:hypothetical protein
MEPDDFPGAIGRPGVKLSVNAGGVSSQRRNTD